MQTSLLKILSVAMASTALVQAASHMYQLYPNPTIAVGDMAASETGSLWIAAADGVYEFDGFRFSKAVDYPFSSARFIEIGFGKSVWVGGNEGLAKFDGRFHVVTREPVVALAAGLSDVIYATDRIHRIRQDGSDSIVATEPGRLNFLKDASGQLLYICGQGDTICVADPRLSREKAETAPLPTLSGKLDQAVRDAAGALWVARGNEAIAYRDGVTVRTLSRNHSKAGELLMSDRTGQVWFLGDDVRGLAPELDLIMPERYRKHLPTAATSGYGHGVWVALSGLGLVHWRVNDDVKRWPSSDFLLNDVTQVTQAPDGAIFAASHGNLHRFDPAAERWTALGKEALHYQSILPLAPDSFLASVRGHGLVRVNGHGEIVETIPAPYSQPNSYRDLVKDSQGRIWVGHFEALFQLVGRPGSYRLRAETLPPSGTADRQPSPLAVRLDEDGLPWVGYAGGLLRQDEQGRWIKVKTSLPIELARSFAITRDRIWVMHRRHGPKLSRLDRNGDLWNTTHDEDALEETRFLARDSRGWIWRGSSNGVFLSDGKRWAKPDWLHLNIEKGFGVDSTDLQSFFEDKDGNVWIAGAEGVARLPANPEYFYGPRNPGRLRRILSDGIEAPREMALLGKAVRFEFGLNFPFYFYDYPIRYRLLPDAPEWQFVRTPAAEYQDLPAGTHTLEMAANGAPGSPIWRHTFQTAAPGWSRAWLWLLSLVPASLAARRSQFYRRTRYRLMKWRYLRQHPRPESDLPAEAGGPYEIRKLISRGGFSEVYEADNPDEPGALLAIKILKVPKGREGWTRDRFRAEVSALQSLRHPGVVPVRDWWIGPFGTPCLAMPFLKGPTLRQELGRGPLDRVRAEQVVRQLGSALGAIHAKGIVHRDLKPENIILTGAGTGSEQAVLIDFGTAGLRAAERELAITSVVAGSWQYMAPELLTGHYSAASDVYSLAVVILEMVCGIRPSDLGAHSSDKDFEGHVSGALAKAVPSETAVILARALRPAFHADPNRRPVQLAVWIEEVCQPLTSLV